MNMDQDILLQMTDITKTFPGVKALDHVSLTLKRGTVHALMGENGAGKSTLMKCLFGIYNKDSGTILLEGKEVNFKNSREALDNGVAMVHQELNQALKRSVMDNIWLGRYPKHLGLVVDETKMYRETMKIFDERGMGDPMAGETAELHGEIELQDVSFSYGGSADAISHVSLHILPGQRISIIGGTGSGKSTLMHLLLGFRAPTQGRILFDGRDAAGLSKHTLRRGISSVLQGAAIYSGTIGENIRMGDPDADDAAVTEAARIAQLSDFIASCEGGLSYEIRQAGKNLSGGQKQRLAIARAIIKDAPIYIFDDSFSALDFLTEKNLRTALNRRIAGRTQIVVTQRITSAMSADCIFVMDGGCLGDSGTHNELLARCRIYREIYASQTGGDLQ